jgi:hypothetical protein
MCQMCGTSQVKRDGRDYGDQGKRVGFCSWRPDKQIRTILAHANTQHTHTHTHTHKSTQCLGQYPSSSDSYATSPTYQSRAGATRQWCRSERPPSRLQVDTSVFAQLMKEVKVSEHIPLGLHTDGVQWKDVLPIVLYGSGSSTPSGSSHQPPSPSSILPRPFLGMVVLGEF